MLKSEIITKLQNKHHNLSTFDIELVLKIFFKKIISSLDANKPIELRGFGTFKRKINKEKQVRNPKNNQLLYKNRTYKLHFKIGKILHKKLNNISSVNDK